MPHDALARPRCTVLDTRRALLAIFLVAGDSGKGDIWTFVLTSHATRMAWPRRPTWPGSRRPLAAQPGAHRNKPSCRPRTPPIHSKPFVLPPTSGRLLGRCCIGQQIPPFTFQGNCLISSHPRARFCGTTDNLESPPAPKSRKAARGSDCGMSTTGGKHWEGT